MKSISKPSLNSYHSDAAQVDFMFVPGKAIYFRYDLYNLGISDFSQPKENLKRFELVLAQPFYVAKHLYKNNDKEVKTSFMDAIRVCNGLSLDDGLSPYYKIVDKGANEKHKRDIQFHLYEVTTNPKATGYRLPYAPELYVIASSPNLNENTVATRIVFRNKSTFSPENPKAPIAAWYDEDFWIYDSAFSWMYPFRISVFNEKGEKYPHSQAGEYTAIRLMNKSTSILVADNVHGKELREDILKYPLQICLIRNGGRKFMIEAPYLADLRPPVEGDFKLRPSGILLIKNISA